TTLKGCCCGNTSIKNVELPYGVTDIIYDSNHNGAFSGCTSLTSITIPSSVTSIGYRAFDGCTSLTSITIPSSVTSIGQCAFSGCTALINANKTNGIFKLIDTANQYWILDADTTITTADLTGAKGIADSAFYDCRALTSITIPSSVTSIGGSAFQGCTALINANKKTDGISKLTDTAGKYWILAADTTITTADLTGAKGIVDSAFYNCRALTSITIPSSVTSIGSGVFADCTSLAGITIPSSVTSIGNSAFYGCAALASINIPSKVTSIGDSAFQDCTSLTSITIPSSVTSIGGGAQMRGRGGMYYGAFSGCTALTSMTIGDAQNGSALASVGLTAFLFTNSAECTLTYYGTDAKFLSLTEYETVVCDYNGEEDSEATVFSYHNMMMGGDGSATERIYIKDASFIIKLIMIDGNLISNKTAISELWCSWLR
ncbi:MAG: leucine-rich repeat domain-containing protein, partial [Clostridia bacterium]